MGSGAWYTPGPPDPLHLPASSHCSVPKSIFALLPLLHHAAFPLLSPGLCSLSLSSHGLVLRRACKPSQLTGGLVRENHQPLEAAQILTKARPFYLLASARLATSAGCPRDSAALLREVGGKAAGAYNRNAAVGRWQGTSGTVK